MVYSSLRGSVLFSDRRVHINTVGRSVVFDFFRSALCEVMGCHHSLVGFRRRSPSIYGPSLGSRLPKDLQGFHD